MINETAVNIVIREIRNYRPNLSAERIRQIISFYTANPAALGAVLAETTEDVLGGYQRALRRPLGRSDPMPVMSISQISDLVAAAGWQWAGHELRCPACITAARYDPPPADAAPDAFERLSSADTP